MMNTRGAVIQTLPVCNSSRRLDFHLITADRLEGTQTKICITEVTTYLNYWSSEGICKATDCLSVSP